MRRIRYIKDPEFYFILFYNMMIIGLYVFDKVEPMFVIWAYYLQSVFMGLQFVVRELVNKTRADGSFFPLSKHAMTGFFMVHYGGFHAVYFIFLVIMSTDLDAMVLVDLIKEVKLTALFLLLNLVLFTGRQIIPSTPNKYQPSIFLAYVRILPMHLVIIIGLNSDWALDAFIIFMLLKVLMDLVMYHFTGGEIVVDEKETPGVLNNK